MSEELKPCPFCGCTILELTEHDYIGDTPHLWNSIECAVCPANMEFDGDREVIVRLWNERE